MTLLEGWQFAPDLDAPAVVGASDLRPPEHGWRHVRVPGFWQSQFRDLARSTGVGWYRVGFGLDDTWSEHDALAIGFGAVGHFCQGWLNGRHLGAHEGGHLPFSWSLGPAARLGVNELFVRVVSPSGDRSRYCDFPFEEILHGKQSWYGPTGGIWQPVDIEARAAHAIAELAVRPDAEQASITLRAELGDGATTTAAPKIEFRIIDPAGADVARVSTSPGESVTTRLDEHQLRRWSPDTPALYRVQATVFVEGRDVDHVEQRFGFRTFAADRGRLLLNGRPVVMRGVLDQDYWGDPGVPSSRQDISDRFTKVKEMGFNTLRCHVKVPDPQYLDVADEIGLLVWCELPTTTRLTEAACERIEETLTAMIARDRHHPSVVVWGIANESWGYDLLGSTEHRAWLKELYHRAKADAPDRLIVDNSPCAPNFHLETDIEDYHFYAVIPEMRQRWDDFLDAFVDRADFTYSPHGDVRRTGSEPLVVSEFGAWGLPDLTDLIDPEGDEPWWFETGQEWAAGAAYVHGTQERFALWHLDRVFGTWAGLCKETQRRQFETLRYQIETMRARPEIAGYVLTELSDVQWEANGLLDMIGRPRSFVDRIAAVNRSPAVIVSFDRSTMWDGDIVRVDVTAVDDEHAHAAAYITCGVSGSGVVTSSRPGLLDPLTHLHGGPFEITATCDEQPRLASIECSLMSEGVRAASVERPVLVVPRIGPQLPPERPVAVTDPALGDRLRGMGYGVTDGDDAELRIMRELSADDQDFIRAGGIGVLLAADTDALGEGFGDFPEIELRAWRDALYGGGEWVSAFSWLRRAGRLAGLPGGPMMDSFFEGLTPDVVITGVPPARFEYDVLAGVFVGWVHQIASLIVRHHAGLGCLLLSTLRLTEQPVGADPLADWLLHQLIATAREQ